MSSGLIFKTEDIGMSRFKIELSDRIKNLPPYLFAAIDKIKKEAISRGVDIINLGIGDPDLPTPPNIIKRLKEASKDPRNHQYPTYEGMASFRKAVADWYKRRFSVNLDPETEVLTLIGSKEGIGHMPLAFIDPGDIVLAPTPGYPVYSIGALFAGGKPYFMPLLKENHFLPDLASIPEDICKGAKLIFINYPNNPTAAVATERFFKDVVEFASRNSILVCHDAAYSEIYYDGIRPPSFLQIDGAKDIGIEFHSLSKTYNMTGWRIGFAVGHKDVISALGKVKSNLDSGVFQAIQEAGIEALSSDDTIIDNTRRRYQKRRDILVSGLNKAGLEAEIPQATFYLWVSVPQGFTSTGFAMHLLDKCGIVATPGNGFGEAGEGYIRFTLTVREERLKEAVERIRLKL